MWIVIRKNGKGWVLAGIEKYALLREAKAYAKRVNGVAVHQKMIGAFI